jgi:hypothetical protein
MPTPTYLWVQQIMQMKSVRDKCDQVADRLAARVNTIAARDNLSRKADPVHQSSGTRPKGRPYSRVGIAYRTRPQAQAELAAALDGTEFGTATTPRTRLIGQSISGARNPNP